MIPRAFVPSTDGGGLVSFTDLIFDLDGPIARIRLNRPQALNAFSENLHAELAAAIERVDADSAIRCAVISGEGRAFSAGIDIKGSGDGHGTRGVEFWRAELQRELVPIQKIWSCSKPVVAQVHGYCLGYACDLAMVCDLTIASEDAQFGEPEIRHVSASTFLIMPFVLGLKKTKELLLTGRRIDAATAAKLGMVNDVVAADRLEEETTALARELSVIAPTAMRLNKASINRAFELMGLRNAADYNLEVFTQVMVSENAADFAEAVRTKGFKEALAERDRAFSA
jgi:enoyl-CoA hydratase/carnithine racemase